jgi:2-keto-4-pentenoate hydratase/2-oxohepta-3-ene-1,7-dioic acid hydratase in catechol pathway
MRLVSFDAGKGVRAGIFVEDSVLDISAAAAAANLHGVPGSVLELIDGGDVALDRVRSLLHQFSADRAAEVWVPITSLRLLAPIPRPRKNVFCVGRNYKAHIEEGARARGVPVSWPTVPEFFSKPPTSVTGPESDIRLDTTLTSQLDYEVELALIIGKSCRDVSPSDAMSYVFGYSIINDISARDLQKRHNQWFKGKGLDTFCPFGPWIIPSADFGDPSGRQITLRVNGETRQDSNTSDQLFDCATIISVLSQGLTLEPGDIIATGTPSGVALGMTPQAWLKDGDVIEAEIEGLGVLRNKVRAVR